MHAFYDEWLIFCLQDDETIGADMGSTRSKFLEVHNDYMKKVQEYDTLYADYARISQVNITSFAMPKKYKIQTNL